MRHIASGRSPEEGWLCLGNGPAGAWGLLKQKPLVAILGKCVLMTYGFEVRGSAVLSDS